MLANYLKFNNEVFPNPLTPTMQSKTIENVSQSESGGDLVCVVRSSKKFWSFKFKLSPLKKEVLRGLCEAESVTMLYMGNTYTVRLRDYQEKLVEGSEWLSTTNGLFECSCKVTEF